MTKKNNKVLGDWGEDLAADFLEHQGYFICARKFRVPVGEIDIIASKENQVIFVEVKTRTSFRFGRPSEAVNRRKQQRIVLAAEWYLRQSRLEYRECRCRFDVIEIYKIEDSWHVCQVKSAFEAWT